MNDESHGADNGFAVSLAMGEAGKDPETKERVIKYLDQQIALHDLHTENLKLQSQALRAQHKQLRSQRLHDRLRSVYQGVLSLIALAVLGIIISAIYSAATDRSVVVNQFQVPPSFDAAGNSGTVVAGEFLDQLQTLQASARTSQAGPALQDAWSNNIQLQVPDVRVSLGDIRRTLHAWLGHETQINGQVVQQDNRIALTVRSTGFAAKTFTGATTDLATLLTQAAGYVYGQSEPYLFATYLQNNGQDAESIALVQTAFSTASAKEKPWLLNAWAIGLTDLNQYAAAVDKYREAIRLDPHFWIAYGNLMDTQILLAQEEAAYQTGTSFEHAARRGSWFAAYVPEINYQPVDYLGMDLPAVHQGFLTDEAAHGGQGSTTGQDAPPDAEMLARMHADRQALFTAQTSPGAGSDHFVIAETDFVQGLLALDQQNYPQAASDLQTTDAMLTQYPALWVDYLTNPACYLGLAEELAGRPDKADAAIAKGGHFVDCYRFKADIADHRGDWLQAQKDYAAAVALAPSLPMAYESWGEALVRHGDYKDAIVKFQQANQRGPHWCDPLEHWGEALAAEGSDKEATQKYAAASKYAPSWGALELHWGQALDKLGKHKDAMSHYQSAQNNSESLSAAEQTTLATLLGQTG
ncbi:MAG: tetratricopeptide repeat protein [Gammaproteobacteria bacterium]